MDSTTGIDAPVSSAVQRSREVWKQAGDERKAAKTAILAAIKDDPVRVRAWLEGIVCIVRAAGPSPCRAEPVGPIARLRRASRARRAALDDRVVRAAAAQVGAAIEGAFAREYDCEGERLRAAVGACFAAMEEWPMQLVEAIRDESDRSSAVASELTIQLAGMLSARISTSGRYHLGKELRYEEPADWYGLFKRRLPGAAWEAVRAERTLNGVDKIRNKVANIIAGPDRTVERRRRASLPDFDTTPDRSNAANFEARVLAADEWRRLVDAAGLDGRDVAILYLSEVAGYTWGEIAARFGGTAGALRTRACRLREKLRSVHRAPGQAAYIARDSV